MLPVQWVGLTQPHQTDKQHHRPQNLHQEADLNRYKVIHMLGTYRCQVPINTKRLTHGNLKAYVIFVFFIFVERKLSGKTMYGKRKYPELIQ